MATKKLFKSNGNLSSSDGLKTEEDESHFLNLPAELRNFIYEYAAQHITTISLKKGHILYAPPLSLVCKQIRKEFEEIFRDEAPRYARGVRIHITNFIHEKIAAEYKALPALAPDVDPVPCAVTVVIHLTNMFDSYLHRLRQMLGKGACLDEEPGARPLPNVVACEVVVDRRSFDVEYFRQILPKLQWAHGSGRQRENTTRDWKRLLEAFEEAMPECVPVLAKPRKRMLSPESSMGGKRRKTINGQL